MTLEGFGSKSLEGLECVLNQTLMANVHYDPSEPSEYPRMDQMEGRDVSTFRTIVALIEGYTDLYTVYDSSPGEDTIPSFDTKYAKARGNLESSIYKRYNFDSSFGPDFQIITTRFLMCNECRNPRDWHREEDALFCPIHDRDNPRGR